MVLKVVMSQQQEQIVASTWSWQRKVEDMMVRLSFGFVTYQGPVVRTPVSANPGLNFNLGFFFFLSKALSRIIFSIFLAYPNIKL